MKIIQLKPFLLLLILFGITVLFESKKCGGGSPPPPPPPGGWQSVSCYMSVYGTYPNSSQCHYNGPETFSNPSGSAGTCNSQYNSYYNQRHYTKIYVRYAGLSTYLQQYCWDGGNSQFIIQVPINRDPTRALLIEFESKERCAYCTPGNNNIKTRAVWKDYKAYTYNQGIPGTIYWFPHWDHYESDNYCN